MNKKAWLDYLFYKVGNQRYDYRLCSLQRLEDGNIKSSKWKKYSELIFPLDFNENWKIGKINNREILPCEVVIDIETEEGIDLILDKLAEDNLNFYAFKTGSRGYHIHIFFKEELTNSEKLQIVKRYGGDEQKAYQGTTIALEYSAHWKTGKLKSFMRSHNGN